MAWIGIARDRYGPIGMAWVNKSKILIISLTGIAIETGNPYASYMISTDMPFPFQAYWPSDSVIGGRVSPDCLDQVV